MISGGSVAETSGGLVKASAQWTPDQYDWLQRESERLGLGSVAAVARFYIQTVMAGSQTTCLHCPIHCQEHEQ